jgi:predicted RNase H-like HicB family nuclease
MRRDGRPPGGVRPAADAAGSEICFSRNSEFSLLRATPSFLGDAAIFRYFDDVPPGALRRRSDVPTTMIACTMTTRIGAVPNIYCSYKDFTGCGEWNAAKNAYDVHVPALHDFGFTVKGENDFPAKMKRHVERYLATSNATRLEFIVMIAETTDGFFADIPDISGMFGNGSTLDELLYDLKVATQGYLNTVKRKKFRARSLPEIRNCRTRTSHPHFLPMLLVLEV